MAAPMRLDSDGLMTMMIVETDSDSSSYDFDSDTDTEDDEDLLLFSLFMQGRELGPRLNLADVPEEDCYTLFRFQKGDIYRLADAFALPEKYVGYNRSAATEPECLLIMLRRLTYPNTLGDLVSFFGHSEEELSILFKTITDDIFERYHTLLENLDLVWLDPGRFPEAIHNRGAPLHNCWGFIDGTAVDICLPTRNQGIMYSGHKRTHYIKFQVLQAPNRMLVHLFVPVEGKRHDAFMLGESALLPQLQNQLNQANGEPYCLFGDPAYPVIGHLLAPFRGANLTNDEQHFNHQMSAVRVSVEHGIGKVMRYFAFLNFLKI